MTNKILTFPKTRARLKELQTTHDEYVAIITAIDNDVLAIMGSNIPILNFQTDDIEKITQCHKDILNDVYKWNSKIYIKLENYPGDIGDIISQIVDKINKVEEYIDDIQEGKIEYEVGITQMITTLGYMGDDASDICDMLTSLKEAINDFTGTQLSDAYDNMLELIERLKEDENIDTKKVEQLHEEIAELKRELADAEAALAGSCIAEAGSIGGIVLGILTGAAGGIICGIFFGIAAAINVYFIVLNSSKIIECKELIERDQKNLNLYEEDVVQLQTYEDIYGDFLGKLDDIKENLSKISDIWKIVYEETEEIKEWLDAHNQEGEIENWSEMKEGLEEIRTTCKNISDQMKILDISDITVTKAELEIGMSSEEVKAAIDSAEKVSFLDYVDAM